MGPRRIADALRGLDAIDLGRQEDVYWALRQSLVARREDLEAFDRAFDAWFLRAAGRRLRREAEPPRRPGQRRKGAQPGPGPEPTVASWSRRLQPRRAAADTGLRGDVTGRVRARPRPDPPDRSSGPRRRTHRLRPIAAGRTLDVRALVRASLATGGDPVRAGVSEPLPRAAQARPAARHLRFDGGVLQGRCCSTCTQRAVRGEESRRSSSARGSRDSPRSSVCATPKRRSPLRRNALSTGRAAPASASR